jgi:cell wall-associated NlpC family hydrolase
MYVGNGTYIHAPRTGDVIKISSIDRPDYITARRVK